MTRADLRTRRMRHRALRAPLPKSRTLAISLASCVAAIAVWEAGVELGGANPTFLPSPSDVVATLWTMLVHGDLLANAGISLLRVWSAFLLSVLMAVPIGILIGGYRIVGAALEPLIDFVRYLPVPALVPLAIIWFGIGEETKIFLLWLGTFFQLVLLVADDMYRVPIEYLEISYTLGARQRHVLSDVAFRAMLPGLVNSMRITLGWCWTYLIIAEIVAANSGLGYVIWTAQRYLQTSRVMAGIVLIGVIGLATDQAIRAFHRRAFGYLA